MKKRIGLNGAPICQPFLAALLAVVVAASGLTGCSGPAPVETIVRADEARSQKPRLSAGSPAVDSVPALVVGNTQFALDLYGALFDGGGNLFLSPHSLSMALAMTYAGARGETEEQMAEALHFSLPQAQLHPAFNALDQALAGRGQDEPGAFQLRSANALWGQEDDTFLAPFLDTLAENYGAGMQLVDLGRAEEARRQINNWGREQTENRIEALLPPGALNAATALVVTNAAYFQAAWQKPFAEDATHDAGFTLLEGSQVMVPTMEQVASLGYAERPGVQAVELPYAGGGLSMVILLPEEGRFETFAHTLDAEQLDTILGALAPTNLHLALPKFRYDAGFALRNALTDLGMIDAFGDPADFSGMDGSHELFIKQVYHQAFVEVDEAGTEATAASAVVVARKGELLAGQEVRVDRPFLFLIRDVDTGAILFLGHVVNPLP
ncbi:MAG: serpin family protein [Anaerolineae bacterium]|jgi:serpin B